MSDDERPREFCVDCRFWELWRDETFGHCHRYPPIPTDDDDYWPKTNDTDWCGEFSSLEKENDYGEESKPVEETGAEDE